MPLPKPSKVISKRFRKPQTLNSVIKPPPALPFSPSLEQPLPPKTSRLRVVCSDPDATDDSSADELDLPTPSRKLFIHEIFLPVSPPSLPRPHSSHGSHARRRRQIPNSIPTAQSRNMCSDLCEAEAVLQDVDLLFDAAADVCMGDAPLQSRVLLPDVERILAEEEFTQFLSEFLYGIGEDCKWVNEMDGSGKHLEDEIANLTNLELDSEVLTWINSFQR